MFLRAARKALKKDPALAQDIGSALELLEETPSLLDSALIS
jgi:hypothetical protein